MSAPDAPEPAPHDATPPELGPRILFFSGGTALRRLSQCLKHHTHNSVHLITPFDSGGSSATLRRAFTMPAVGDIRNRLLALADETLVPAAVFAVWQKRLPATGERDALLQELYDLAADRHPLWQGVPESFGEIMRQHLRHFLERMPETFDPRLAIVGNLLLAGGYVRHGKNLEPVLTLMQRLLHVRGTVLPCINESLHLAAELRNGDIVVGQHHITGHGGSPLPAPIKRIFLSVHERPELHPERAPCTPHIASQAATHIRTADLVCFPMGSFYSSVLANLLPVGAGRSVAQSPCPKCYIPNTGTDPEQMGLSVAEGVRILLEMLRRDAPDMPTARLLNHVLVDTRNGDYPGGIDAEGIAAQGVELLDMPLVEPNTALHDPEAVSRVLLRLTRGSAR